MVRKQEESWDTWIGVRCLSGRGLMIRVCGQVVSGRRTDSLSVSNCQSVTVGQ